MVVGPCGFPVFGTKVLTVVGNVEAARCDGFPIVFESKTGVG